MLVINTKEDIIPRVGLGGIKIGDKLKDLQSENNAPKIVNGQKMLLLNEGAIFVLFSKEDKVVQVSARRGYEGRLFDRHFVGEPIINYINDNDWEFSESDDGFVLCNIAGVVVHPDLEDATPEEMLKRGSSLSVNEITVCN